MSVAVAYQSASSTHTLALQEGALEAKSRRTDLVVLNVVESLDLDLQEAYRAGLESEITQALASQDASEVAWKLELSTAKDDEVAEEILRQARDASAQVLVIGARRRSPLGKFLMGSATQSLILEADVPVLVVKAPA